MNKDREVLIPLHPKSDFHVRLFLEKENEDLKGYLNKAMIEVKRLRKEVAEVKENKDADKDVKMNNQRILIKQLETKLKGMKIYRTKYIELKGLHSAAEKYING